MKEKGTDGKMIFCKKNNKTYPVSERDAYLELLVTEIFSYSVGHGLSEKFVYPASICIEYVKYQNKYWKYFNTCLRRFDGYKKESLEGEKGEYLLDLINNEIHEAIDDAVNLIKEEKIDGLNLKKNKFKNYRINLINGENDKAHPNLKQLFEKILSKTREENVYIDQESETEHLYIHVPEIGKSRLDKFEKKIHAIGKAGLMLEAFEFSKKRAALNDNGKYKFKKQVKTIAEACENSLINSMENELKAKHKDKPLSKLAEFVVNNNEIIGNNLYLIDESGFQKAVEKHIKENSEKFSYSDSN